MQAVEPNAGGNFEATHHFGFDVIERNLQVDNGGVHAASLRYCYSLAQLEQGGLQGRFELSLFIAYIGRIEFGGRFNSAA
ncbi:hypothetical protein GCM10007874_54630 [Labrys miyagiensis]|uniref:Uncharacterized protein n=1 Tax=Labrys miyagiensis TaxID=346912 RepID=A0ABQ6CQP3_9HYPH|nr:hypothetical protein GCM10007874_54630 [Labrys miyagiensis]